ncbi:MAG: hypothetical protein HGA96_05450 [Desulfobulbaceae bacterium]|nr:hypothetical protein [Desulfobulbaceae bacterium]
MTEIAADLSRAVVYRFLAGALAYPEKRWMRQGYPAALVEFLAAMGWEEEVAELAGLPVDSEQLLFALQLEHTRLFINAVPQAVAPPYGSVYLPDGGTLNTAFTAGTRDSYRRHGFDLAAGNALADYLPLELEFLAHLHEAGEKGAIGDFLQGCFFPWFGEFRRRVQLGAELPYYRVLVELIDFLTKEEEEYGD